MAYIKSNIETKNAPCSSKNKEQGESKENK